MPKTGGDIRYTPQVAARQHRLDIDKRRLRNNIVRRIGGAVGLLGRFVAPILFTQKLCHMVWPWFQPCYWPTRPPAPPNLVPDLQAAGNAVQAALETGHKLVQAAVRHRFERMPARWRRLSPVPNCCCKAPNALRPACRAAVRASPQVLTYLNGIPLSTPDIHSALHSAGLAWSRLVAAATDAALPRGPERQVQMASEAWPKS